MENSNILKVTNNLIEIVIFKEISDWWGFSKNDVIRALKNHKGTEIRLVINSLGGDLPEAIAIHDLLKAHRAKVVAECTGIVASAATIIACAADEINMSKKCLYMIHRASWGNWGNADDLRSAATALDGYDQILVDTYTEKTGLEEEAIRDMIQHDFWMTARQALDLGFVDNIVDTITIDFDQDIVDSERDRYYDYDDFYAAFTKPDKYLSNQVCNLIAAGSQVAPDYFINNISTMSNKKKTFGASIFTTLLNKGLVSQANEADVIAVIDQGDGIQDFLRQQIVTAFADDEKIKALLPKSPKADALTVDTILEAISEEEDRQRLYEALMPETATEGEEGNEPGEGKQDSEAMAKIEELSNTINSLKNELFKNKGERAKAQKKGEDGGVVDGKAKPKAKVEPTTNPAKIRQYIKAYSGAYITAEEFKGHTGMSVEQAKADPEYKHLFRAKV